MKSTVTLTFDGPKDLVTPAAMDAEAALRVALAFVETLKTIGAHEAADDVAPFSVAFTSVDKGSVSYGFAVVKSVPAWETTLAKTALYLETPDASPPSIANRVKGLAKAVQKLPPYVTTSATIGDHIVSISDLSKATSADVFFSTETFRAELLRTGGKSAKVMVQPSHEPTSFSLDTTREKAAVAGRALYRQADITATLRRRVDDLRVVGGDLDQIELLDEDADAVKAFDEWWSKAGTPWSDVDDIDNEIRRGRK